MTYQGRIQGWDDPRWGTSFRLRQSIAMGRSFHDVQELEENNRGSNRKTLLSRRSRGRESKAVPPPTRPAHAFHGTSVDGRPMSSPWSRPSTPASMAPRLEVFPPCFDAHDFVWDPTLRSGGFGTCATACTDLTFC
eukprot:s825_g15.t1